MFDCDSIMPSNLFRCFNFLVIEDDKENKDNLQEVTNLLKDFEYNNIYCFHVKNSPNLNNYNSIKKFFIKEYNYKSIHFIISNNVDFLFYQVAAFDYLIPIVSLQWIEQCISRNHLLRTLNFSPDPKHLLKDTTIYIVRNPTMTHTDYRFYSEIVTALGGVCLDVLTNKVTHIISISCFDPNMVKIYPMIKNIGNTKIVYATWLLECFKTSKYADESKHKVDMAINDDNDNDTRINISYTRIDERFEDLWEDLENSSELCSQSIKKKYLEGHTFIIDLDLSLSSKIYKFLIQLIKFYGGNFVPYIKLDDIESNKNIDCFIGESINTKSFELCKKKGIYTGNIIWFFNIWLFETLIDPKKKMIWSPFKSKLFKSKDLILSHTNYFGQERIYIQKLTEILGGITTTSLSSQNTHLLVKIPFGKKYLNATTKKPNCKVINHIWLEKCYLEGVILDTDQDLFKDFDICQKGLSYFLNQIGNDDNSHEADKDEENASKVYELFEKNNITNDTFSSGEETDIGFSTANENQINPLFNYMSIDRKENVDTKEDGLNLNKLNSKSGFQSEKDNLESNQVESSLQNKKDNKVETEEDKYQELFGSLSEPPTNFNTNSINDTEQIIDNNDISSNNNIDSNNSGMSHTPLVSKQSFISEDKISRADRDMIVNEIDKLTNNENKLSKTLDKSLTQPTDDILEQYNPTETSSRRRAARAKAEKRLHEDIESLNEFERNKKKKRIGDLLPSEIEKLEHIKELKNKAKEVVLSMKELSHESNKEETLKKLKHSYNVKAFVTGCHDDINELDKEILSLMGIQITEDYKSKLNCIIAPKKLRTIKFFNGLSFHPLEYILTPEFITKILEYVHHKENPVGVIKCEDFRLQEIDNEILEKTKLNSKLFERAYIANVNITSDVTGGIETISSILMNHGIKKVQRIGKSPLLVNNHSHKRIILKRGKAIHPPRCVIIAGSNSNVRKLKKRWSTMNNDNMDGLLVVTWDWCVQSIFQLDVDYNEKKDVLYSSL